MPRCNIFRPLSKFTGEFLLFSQYTEDLTKESAQKTMYRVVPSKFAVLDVDPEKLKNGSESINSFISKHLQCQFENSVSFIKEELEKTGGKYTPEISNLLFWRSIKDMGLVNETTNDDGIKEYPELKYIGDINIYNNHSYDSINYNEIYCYIPTNEPAYHYRNENVGEKKGYDYRGSDLMGWNESNYPTNIIIENKPIFHTQSMYYVGGVDIPSQLCPIRDNNNVSLNLLDDSSTRQSYVGYYGKTIIKIKDILGSELDGLYLDDHQVNVEDVIILDQNNPRCRLISKTGELKSVYVDNVNINKNSLEGITFEIGEDYIEFYIGDEYKYEFNCIILFYDIYNNTDPEEPILLYRNIPMGIYFTGYFDGEGFTNKVTKYVSNDDAFGQGSSYGLRICTKFVCEPSSEWYETDVMRVADDYSEIASTMGYMKEAISTMTKSLNTYNTIHQNIKDHLVQFKNYRVNVPYIREVNGKKVWFINGRNTEMELKNI